MWWSFVAMAAMQAQAAPNASSENSSVAILMYAVTTLPLGAPVPENIPRTRLYEDAWSQWIRPADLPRDLARQGLNATSRIMVDTDVAGRPVGCRIVAASTDPRLDELACRRIRQRGRFSRVYLAPRQAGPASRLIEISWRSLSNARLARERQLLLGPPVPASFGFGNGTRMWPRTEFTEKVELAGLPDVQSAYPQAATAAGEAKVGVELFLSETGEITGCRVGQRSRNLAHDTAFDAASCDVARRVPLRYVEPCDRCWALSVPIQLVWRRGGGSHVRFPLPARANPARPPLRDPADDRRATTRRIAAPFNPLPPITIFRSDLPRGIIDAPGRRASVRIAFDEFGTSTGCTVRSLTREAVDTQLCDLVRAHPEAMPRTDVFGDPIAGAVSFEVLITDGAGDAPR